MDDRQGDSLASPHHVSSFQDRQIQTTARKEMGRKNLQLVSICVETAGWRMTIRTNDKIKKLMVT